MSATVTPRTQDARGSVILQLKSGAKRVPETLSPDINTNVGATRVYLCLGTGPASPPHRFSFVSGRGKADSSRCRAADWNGGSRG